MCARTTKNTHWSDFVEPAAKPEPEHEEATDGPLVFIRRDPSWVREIVPMFPIKALFGDFLGSAAPANACPHHGPFKAGSVFCCMECHRSGMDHDPALKRDPLTDPKPEPEPTSIPLTAPGKHDGSRKSEQWAPYSKGKGRSSAA